jgi:hypothetical protein
VREKIRVNEQRIQSKGFSTELWVPPFGWTNEDEKREMVPKIPQLLAAYEIFISMFVDENASAWVHLAAEMQAGKTGVMTTVIRLVLQNFQKLGIRPDRMFVLTGMSDNAWKKQTEQRLPSDCRMNVFHNKGLEEASDRIVKLHHNDRQPTLRNVIIFLDESHIACAPNNQPSRVWGTLQNLCPVDQWKTNHIHIITISATDPVKVLEIGNRMEASVVRLRTTPAYQSIEKLLQEGRIRYNDALNELHSEQTLSEIENTIREKYNQSYRYHLLRPLPRKHKDLIDTLYTRFPYGTFPNIKVIEWDAKSRGDVGRDVSSDEPLNDINDVLSNPPTQHTFIVLKNMLYAAKTLNDKYVGVMYDRLSVKDSTNLQSLLGRACGYGKSKDTIIYTSEQTVNNYIQCWRDLCTGVKTSCQLSDVNAGNLKGRMAGVNVRKAPDGSGAVLSINKRATQAPLRKTAYNKQRSPSSSDDEGGDAEDDDDESAGESARKPRQTADESKFNNVWHGPYRTFEELKQNHLDVRSHRPKMVDGFYLSSTTGTTRKLTLNDINVMKKGKKTANLPWSTMKPNESRTRLYVAYRDPSDPASVEFYLRILTRLE